MANEKRLIDANAFLKALNERPLDFLDVGGDFGYFDETIDSVVNEQPTVDAVEVVHGAWVQDTDWEWDYNCSACGMFAIEGRDGNFDRKTAYCPHCGAKMDGERKDNERKAD